MLLACSMLTLGLASAADATAAPPGASYTAQLSGGEEVPPHNTPASGQATFQVSADGQSLTYSVTVSNITNVIAGHIHIAPKGTNGDIVLPLVPTASPGGGPRSGVIGQGTATAAQLIGPMQGKTMADLLAQIDAGNAYVNVHTASGASPATQMPGDFPPGEIRGQIVPSSPSTMPGAGGGFAARRDSRPLALAAVALLAVGVAGVTRLRRYRR
jgi:hypothetical protein